jgi:putative ABC transport system permease protein
MRLYDIAHLYRVRLKARSVAVQEGFVVVGIAVGVALLFASQVASTSLDGSVRQLTSGVIGQSQYQLKARSTQGFDGQLLGRVQRIAGVRAAIPVLEREVNLTGPKGSAPVDLIATDPHYVHLAGTLLRHFSVRQLAGQQALALPAPIASAIGAGSLEPIKVQIGAQIAPSLVATVLEPAEIGSLIHSPVAIAPLAYARQLTDMQGKLTRILIQVRPGAGREVLGGLSKLAAAEHLNVEPGDFDATLFSQAAMAIDKSTETFAAICALVGFMFAYSSMLLTMHLRRRLVSELRLAGATRGETAKALLFDALVLGVLACAAGLALGDLLSVLAFSSSPEFLSFAFPVGSQRIVTWESVAISVAAGLVAACVGVLSPLRDIWARPGRSASTGERRPVRRLALAMLGGGLACLGATTAILLAAPRSSILGIVALVLAVVLLLPLLVVATIEAFDRLQHPLGAVSSALAVVELRAPRARVRSIAIASTAAIAVFGSVTIEGSRANLQAGLEGAFHGVSTVADLWVQPAGVQNLFATVPFHGFAASRLTGLPGIRAIGVYYSSFMEVGDRRVWVLAPPPTAGRALPASELVSGNLALAEARLRAGGWAVISQTLASEHHLRIGGRFTLPSPHPTSLRIAALSTNLGWPPGVIFLDGRDYLHAWGAPEPTAFNVMLAAGASPATVSREIRDALARAGATGLTVQTALQHERSQQAAGRQGLERLTEVALLVLIAGVLATATSMGAVIWERRRQFARLKMQGFRSSTLWLALVWESALLLGAGCLLGALSGIYGQLLLSHALVTVTGFPVTFSASVLLALESFAALTVVAAAIIAIPGYRVASVRPHA